MIIDELITLLKFDAKNLEKAEAYKKLVENIGTVAKTTAAVITGAVASVGYFAKSVAESTAENYEWAKSAGVSYDTYQKFDHVAKVLGKSLDDVKEDMNMWTRAAAASGQTIEEIFLKEAKAVEGLSAEQSKALLSQKGYSETAIKMIQAGEGELARLLSQANVLPEQNLKASVEFSRTWRNVISQIGGALSAGVASALPSVRGILQAVTNFVMKNKDLISTNVGAFFRSVAIAVKILFYAISPVVYIIVNLLRVLDFLSFGLAKYLVLVPLLTATITALAISLGVKTYLAMKSLIAEVGSYIVKTGILIAQMKTRLVIERVDLIMKGKQMVANRVLEAQTVKQQSTLIGMIIWKIKKIALEIKDRIVTLSNAAAHWVAGGAVKFYQLAIASSVAWAWKAILATGRWIATIAAQTIGVVGLTIAIVAEKVAIVAAMVVTGAITAATWLWTAAQWALNAAMYANPVGLIVLAVVAVIAAIVGLVYLIVKYWDKIASSVVFVWDILKKMFGWWWTAVKKIFSIFTGVFQDVSEMAQNIFGGTFDWIMNGISNIASGIWNNITGVVSKVFAWLKNIPGIKWVIDLFKTNAEKSNLKNNKKAGEGKEQVSGLQNTSETIMNYGPSNKATKNVSNSDNSSRSVVINNNNVINTSASNGPAIANYLKNANVFQSAGFGMAGTV